MKMQSSIMFVLSFVLSFMLSVNVVRAQEANGRAPAAQQPVEPRPTGDNWIDPQPSPSPEPAQSKSSVARPRRPAPATPASKFAAPETQKTKATQASTAVNGQWVFTQQYGWVWLQYAREYTYVGHEGYPYTYAYYPRRGWCWLYSPWVLGWGPGPDWGVNGRERFEWYAHPWFGRAVYRVSLTYRGFHGAGIGFHGFHRGYRGGYHRGGFRGGGRRGHR